MHFAFRTPEALGVLQKNLQLLLLKWCINSPAAAGSETRDHSIPVKIPTPYNHYTTFTTQPHFFAT